MRISAERQAARLRVTKTQIHIHQAIEDAIDDIGSDLTYAEIMLALNGVTGSFMEIVFKAETPLESESDGRKET